MKTFPQDQINQIHRALDELGELPQPAIAAFDADGTLWDTDLGENFLQYQMENQLVPFPDQPWEYYHQMKIDESPEAAYFWLAQINEGRELAEVRDWAKEALKRIHPVPYFEEQKELVHKLKKIGAEVFIVTASVAWAVEPAAELVGISPENVIGIRAVVENGKITNKPDGPITYKEGKVKGLLNRTQGVAPFFTSGNSEGDLPLLESATHLRLTVAATKPGHENYEIEQSVLNIGREKGWLSFSLT